MLRIDIFGQRFLNSNSTRLAGNLPGDRPLAKQSLRYDFDAIARFGFNHNCLN
jgi:hypothetical protein